MRDHRLPLVSCQSLNAFVILGEAKGLSRWASHHFASTDIACTLDTMDFSLSNRQEQVRDVSCYGRLLRILAVLALTLWCKQSLAQGVAVPGMVCKPVSQRTQEIGCWIMADDAIGQLTKPQVFWHLDSYPTRDAAMADKRPRGVVIEALGKVWLLTIEDEKWRPVHGNRVAEIGPLAIVANENYSAQYMEAIFTPGMTAPAHIHSGPEAWHTVAGETCLETSDGRVQIGRAGGPPVIVPVGLSMHLTATGAEQRRALVLILHKSSELPSTLVHDWTPKGLCKNKN